jgi:hypothetical protein
VNSYNIIHLQNPEINHLYISINKSKSKYKHSSTQNPLLYETATLVKIFEIMKKIVVNTEHIFNNMVLHVSPNMNDLDN